MPLPRAKKSKKANVSNPKDSNGKAERPVKEQYRGRVSKDAAKEAVHSKFGTTGKGPRKKVGFKKND